MGSTRISYKLIIEQPQQHYYRVEATLTNPIGVVWYRLPTWTPGSYLMREYSGHCEAFAVYDPIGTPQHFEKVNKNTFKIHPHPNTRQITISYRVYAFDLTVRTNYLDAEQGYITPAATFGYFDGYQELPATLTILPPPHWQSISTALQPIASGKAQFHIPDFDTLVDSPILAGTHQSVTFEACGIPHTLAWYGPLLCNLPQLLQDIATIAQAQCQAMGGQHPCKAYLFILHLIPGGRGGLEHLHSTCLMADPQALTTSQGYRDFLGLVSHEYFHLWNGKRLRPYELGPFDYSKENHTTLLWQVEGFTSYFDDLFLRRTNLIGTDAYLKVLERNFNYAINHPATQDQSLAQSSFDAWVKFYRPNPNTPNAVVSYYVKGAAIATLLDVIILHHSGGRYRLDHVVTHLYQQCHLAEGRGFTHYELTSIVNHLCGANLTYFFDKHVTQAQLPNWNQYLAYVGLQLVPNNPANQTPELGISLQTKPEGLLVTGVRRNGPAENAGLQPNDELLAINNFRIKTPEELQNWLEAFANTELTITLSRQGQLKTIKATATAPLTTFVLQKLPTATTSQKQLYAQWLADSF